MISRRQFLATLPFAAATASAAPIGKVKIKDVQVMLMQGDRTYTLVKITADNGVYGIGEAYGSPGIGVKEQILGLKPWLIGKDPLQIDTLYTGLGSGGRSLSGTRTDGSAHMLMRAASGIEMTLWDLAGKILGVPTSTLLGGRFRDKVRVYDHAAHARQGVVPRVGGESEIRSRWIHLP
jgi:gluconate/galactonate dehydratase